MVCNHDVAGSIPARSTARPLPWRSWVSALQMLAGITRLNSLFLHHLRGNSQPSLHLCSPCWSSYAAVALNGRAALSYSEGWRFDSSQRLRVLSNACEEYIFLPFMRNCGSIPPRPWRQLLLAPLVDGTFLLV